VTPNLTVRKTKDASVGEYSLGEWRLSIAAGPPGYYRLAQLDDYSGRTRGDFLWKPPVRLDLRARVSQPDLPGTWGFGFWNDPFNASMGLGGSSRRLPALPNAAWFFFASPANYLSLRDDRPAQGFLAATYSSPAVPAPLLGMLLVGLPLLGWSASARYLRRLARRSIHDDSCLVETDVAQWHTYGLAWHEDRVHFFVDGDECFATDVVPHPPLGLVLWIDNQYAALPPAGRLRFGTLANPRSAWLEMTSITVEMGVVTFESNAATP